MTEALFLVIGLTVGGAAAWLLARAHFRERARIERAAVETRVVGLETLEKELGRQLTERQLEVGDLRAALDGERTERARAEERAAAERRNLDEQCRLLEDARAQLANAFRALSAEALEQSNAAYLERAREAIDAQLGRREQAVEALLKPLHDALRRAEDQVREIENTRRQAWGGLEERLRALAEQSRELGRETGKLASALRSSQTRGRWGEIALRRIVEIAGMTVHCDFSEQVTLEGEAGRLRPDMVVHLPGRRDIVIDAKAPLDAYDDALSASGEEERQRALARHAQQVRLHMTQLSAKAYWKQLDGSPDLVVMFIPGESFVAAAVEADERLLVDAMERRVLIATPTTLFALLSAVAHGWQQQRLADSAEEVRKLGHDLYERVASMGGHVRGIGTALGRAVEAYNDAVGSMERRVLPAARRFRDLGIGARDDIPVVETLDHVPRTPTAAEFAEQLELASPSAESERRSRRRSPGVPAETSAPRETAETRVPEGEPPADAESPA